MDRKVWLGDVRMAHPKKWVVMINVDWADTDDNKMMGEIYLIADTREEAHLVIQGLEDSVGKTAIVEGFNDAPQIGGLFR